MAKISVYQNDIKVAEHDILHEYYIMETYEQPEDYLLFYEKTPDIVLPPRQIRIWLQNVDFQPEIMTVLPDWLLIINNVEMEKKLYTELELEQGSKIELQYKNYKFKIEL